MTAIRVPAIARKVSGSSELTPKSIPLRKRQGECADRSTTVPAGESTPLVLTGGRRRRRAAEAMRMPISLRCATA